MFSTEPNLSRENASSRRFVVNQSCPVIIFVELPARADVLVVENILVFTEFSPKR